jgi:hypothetical protein
LAVQAKNQFRDGQTTNYELKTMFVEPMLLRDRREISAAYVLPDIHHPKREPEQICEKDCGRERSSWL